MTREEIVAEARTWLGTPFHHQGRVKGVGTDCAGIIAGVLNHFNIKHKDYSNYTREESVPLMRQSLDEALIKIDKLEPGAVVLFYMRRRDNTCHVGIMETDEVIIHADMRPGIKKVTRMQLSSGWKKRIHTIYRLPGVE